MDSKNSDIFEYEAILLGRKTNFKKANLSQKEKETKIANIWGYAVTELLGWTPKEAVYMMDENIVKMLCLDRTYPILGYIPTQTFRSDFRMFLQYAFPESVKFDFTEQTLSEYKHVAKLDKWSNDKEFYRYPKNFFRGREGLSRAKICLQYALSVYMSDLSIEDQYNFFSNDKKAAIWLKRYCLDGPYNIIFTKDALDYFHYSLKDEDKNNVIFYNKMIGRCLCNK